MKYTVAIFILLSVTCCNPAKRLARQNEQFERVMDEYNKNHPVRIDTATVYIQGIDSSSYFKAIADSLKKILPEVKNAIDVRYRDTCTSAKTIFTDGYNMGYELGLADCNTRYVTTTIIRTVEKTGLIDQLKKENQRLQAETAAALLKESHGNKWFWLFIISCILNILLLTVLLKKIFKK